MATDADSRSAQEKYQDWKNEQARRERERQEAEAERQRQAEAERHRQAEVERERQAEAERRRQAEAEKAQQAEAERRRQAETEKARQADAERRKQAEAERERRAEAERHKQAEAEHERQAEAERRRQAEAERERERERERHAEAERRKQAEAERERQAETERRKQAEAEREHRAEVERERQRHALAERHRHAELERERQAEAEQHRRAEAEAQRARRESEKQQQAERQQLEKEAEREAQARGLDALEIAQEKFVSDPATAFSQLEQSARYGNPLAKGMLTIWGNSLDPSSTPSIGETGWNKLTSGDIQQLRWMAKQNNDVLAQLVLAQLFALGLIETDPHKDGESPAANLLALAMDNGNPIPHDFLVRLCRLNADDRRAGSQGLGEFCQAKRAGAASSPLETASIRHAEVQPPPQPSQTVQPSHAAVPIAPAHRLRVLEPEIMRIPEASYGLAKNKLSFAEWNACVEAGGCPPINRDSSYGRDDQPVVNISWLDAQTYIQWLNKATGKRYRLPTGEEWDYAALAGVGMFMPGDCGVPSAFGDTIPCLPPGYPSPQGDGGYNQPNPFGLFNMLAGAQEWIADCVAVRGQPTCEVRGGSQHGRDPYHRAKIVMPAHRYTAYTSFRLALDLPY